jgi:hypothetical protein
MELGRAEVSGGAEDQQKDQSGSDHLAAEDREKQLTLFGILHLVYEFFHFVGFFERWLSLFGPIYRVVIVGFGEHPPGQRAELICGSGGQDARGPSDSSLNANYLVFNAYNAFIDGLLTASRGM